MILYLEVMTGKRRGKVIELDSESNLSLSLPYVLETEALKLSVDALSITNPPRVFIEDATITLLPNFDKSGSIISYSSSPIYKNGIFQGLFYNYFGVANFYIQLDEDELIDIGQIDVLARKASVQQVEVMLDYIVASDESELLNIRGATRRGANTSLGNGGPPKRLLEKLISNLDLLEEWLPYLINSPITTLRSREELKSGSPYIDIQEQEIAWLSENASVLEASSDPDTTLLNWYGTALAPKFIQTSVMYESADVYENQIILGYLENLLQFTNDIKGNLVTHKKEASLNAYEGYVSFFGSTASKLLEMVQPSLHLLGQIQERILMLRNAIYEHVGVKTPNYSFPRFTPKVRSNRVYSSLFRMMVNWYQENTLNWESQKLLIAIDSIPKLFELYSSLLIRRWCDENGKRSKVFKESSAWEGNIYGFEVKLCFEPKYWMVGHVKQSGEIMNTENRTVSTAINDRANLKRSHKFQRREPDVVFEVRDSNARTSLHVLDAKYTNEKKAFEEYLPECTMKYVHGLSSSRNTSLVDSFMILYPDMKNGGTFLDFHTIPYNLFGETPQLPALGAIGLSMNNHNDFHDVLLNKVLERLFQSIRDTRLN